MKRIPLLLTAVIFTAGCGLYTACKNDCPSQPPVLPPGHTALALTAKQVSTRWLTLQWKNDSTAVSRAYVLLRNGKDTVFVNTTAITSDTITVKDSSLTPSTTYNYELYRIYNGTHWDSATAQVRMLDTTKDNYSFTITKLGLSGAVLYAVWGTNPQSVWLGGSVDSGDIIHYVNGQLHYMQDVQQGIFKIYSIYGTSDSNVWFGGGGVLGHWDGKSLTSYVFNGDSLPSVQQNFKSIWISPDSEIFVIADGGSIVHRSANGKWDTMSSGTSLALTSIVGFASNDVYASGGYSNISGILLHYNGTNWTTILQYPGPFHIANITGVWGQSPDSLYIAGNLILHRKGTTWEDRTPQQQQYYAESIHSDAWNNVFVCGDFGMLIKFDGDHWVNENVIPPDGGTIFEHVFTVGGEVFVVGASDNNAYFIHGK